MTSARRRARASPEPDPITDAVRFLARGERSASQIERYLIGRGHAKLKVRSALHTMRRLGYVDDKKAAVRVARARLARRPMGTEALIAELTARGFPADAIDGAVRDAYEGATEQAIAARLLEALPPRSPDAVREGRRRAALLKRRGFSEDVIETLVADKVFHANPDR